MMTAEEVRKLSDQDLQAKLAQLKGELAEMKRINRISPLDNPMRITSTRKAVARLSTELTQRKA